MYTYNLRKKVQQKHLKKCSKVFLKNQFFDGRIVSNFVSQTNFVMLAHLL